MRILIAEHDGLAAAGLVEVLEADGGFEVVGRAATCSETLRATAATSPDVVLVDIGLPDGGGLACLQELHDRFPGVPVCVLGSMPAAMDADATFPAGRQGVHLDAHPGA